MHNVAIYLVLCLQFVFLQNRTTGVEDEPQIKEVHEDALLFSP